MPAIGVIKWCVGVSILLVLAGCTGGGAFQTYFETPVSQDSSQTWKLQSVEVTVPRSLSVSEQRTIVPKADIVWREDPPGDRYAQVDTIMTSAITRGARALPGRHPVRVEATMTRFHAMTFEAESLRYDVGVHNVHFTITVRDARTGQVIAGPALIDASFPAKTGAAMAEARARGETQRSQIEAHVAQTVQAWLGIGPDNRGTFVRVGN